MNRAIFILAVFLSPTLGAQVPAAPKDGASKFKVARLNYLITGRVTDWASDHPIVAATVATTDSKNTVHRTLTRTDGSYRLDHLPRESLTLTCSQLDYNPNPQTGVVEPTSGEGKWDTKLIKASNDSDYLTKVIGKLSSLTGSDSAAEAKFVAKNVNASTLELITVKLDEKEVATPESSSRMKQVVAVFDAEAWQKDKVSQKSPLPEEQIRQKDKVPQESPLPEEQIRQKAQGPKSVVTD